MTQTAHERDLILRGVLELTSTKHSPDDRVIRQGAFVTALPKDAASKHPAVLTEVRSDVRRTLRRRLR